MSIIALQKNKKLYKFMYDKKEKQNLLKLMTGKSGLMFGGILPIEIEEHILSFLIPYKKLFQEILDDLKWANTEIRLKVNFNNNENLHSYYVKIPKISMERFENSKQLSKNHYYCKNTFTHYENMEGKNLFKKNISILRYKIETKEYIKKNIIPYFFQFVKLKGNRKHIWIHPTTGKHYEKNYLYSLINNDGLINNDESNDYIMPKYRNKNTALIKLIMSF